MATLVSRAAYARLHGKSPQAAGKWEAKGCMVFIDGKVHVEASDQRMMMAALGRYASPSTEPAKHQSTASTVNRVQAVDGERGPVDLSDPKTLQTLNAFVEQLLTGQYADAATAATVKENALALKHVLAARREAGELIDLETAERTLFEAARTTREAWMNFPTRTGPLIAAELGIDSDRLVEVLASHVHQQLADIGKPEDAQDRPGTPEAGLPTGNDPAAADQHP